MKQSDLNRAVARATGETVERIERMGFQLAVMPMSASPAVHDLHLDRAYGDCIDWDTDTVATPASQSL